MPGRPGGYRKSAVNQSVAVANRVNSPVEITGGNQGKANLSPNVKNENPGALAGASGATVKADQLQSKEYTDARATTRRVDLSGAWNLARWDWKRAVRKDRTLSDAAKLLAAALCDDFAHHETAFCNPTVETLADALGKSVRPVQRALAELRDAQWITIKYAEGRGKKSEISFLGGQGISALKPSEKVTHMASRDAKGVSSVAPIATTTMAKRVPENAKKGCHT